ncbi:vesicle-associated membrane protein 2-like [Cylas formicarius]|uniref:vesicle-associated membrane protein 2-like n=1 Tax=Cylas formicarius TaxID=197179 RepID=UPI0029586817|nr:vesicle-associated membrane protein 2-like [Cylas formicarius]
MDSNTSTTAHLDQTQKRLDDIVDIMRHNIDKVLLTRNPELIDLDQRAKHVKEKGELFKLQAEHVKRKYWFQNHPWVTALGVICSLLIAAMVILELVDARVYEERHPVPVAASENNYSEVM